MDSRVQTCLLGVAIATVCLIIVLAMYHFCVPEHYTKNMKPYFTPITTLPRATSASMSLSFPPASSVVIFMVATPDISEYAAWSIAINQRYAKRHGFHFVVIRENLLGSTVPINFTKFAAIRDVLVPQYPEAQFFVHIDADAAIVDESYDLRHIIATQMTPRIHLLLSEDCYDTQVCSKPNKANSGVFILRNSPIGRAMIHRWLQIQPGQCGYPYVDQFPNCQLVFEHCVRPLFWGFIQLAPYNLLNGVDGLFIHHHMQQQTRDRIDAFKAKFQDSDEFQEGRTRIRVYG